MTAPRAATVILLCHPLSYSIHRTPLVVISRTVCARRDSDVQLRMTVHEISTHTPLARQDTIDRYVEPQRFLFLLTRLLRGVTSSTFSYYCLVLCQTNGSESNNGQEFDYHMKLHYSQTHCLTQLLRLSFDYHMKLHYSQTVFPNT